MSKNSSKQAAGTQAPPATIIDENNSLATGADIEATAPVVDVIAVARAPKVTAADLEAMGLDPAPYGLKGTK
jgi:hypothetical protein